MSQIVSIFGFFCVVAAAYGADRLIYFFRLQMAKTFDMMLYLPLNWLVTIVLAAILLAYTIYVLIWSRKDMIVGIVLLVFGLAMTLFCILTFLVHMQFVVLPGSYLAFTSAFTALLGLALLVLPEKRHIGRQS
jgi:hypothetical protein